MRVTVMVKATQESEAGVMLAGEGLHPSARGRRVQFSGSRRTVVDGPFAETKELVAGFWLWQVKSMEDAVEWVKRCPNPMQSDSEIEIRPLFEAADFGAEFTLRPPAVARCMIGASDTAGPTMDTSADRVRDAALRLQAELADERTPFVTDEWYVAAFADEVTRKPLARRLLGFPVVLLRRTDGGVAALEDRCPHRSMPLSLGTLEGDTLVCGYHGARFGCDGVCSGVPSQSVVPPGARTRAFPVEQHGPLVWIWMGASAPTQAAPHPGWIDDAGWAASRQKLHMKASYVRLHENLLDLTHLSFLHARTFGTPDYASAPYETAIDAEAGRFVITRSVVPTRLPPIWARPTGLEGMDAARIASSTFVSAALHEVRVSFHACDRPAAEQPSRAIRTAHIVTPESATSTHYFIHHARNFALEDGAITAFMHEQLLAAFQEDIDGLEAIERNLANYPPGTAHEISFHADRPSLAMRRWLKRRATGR